MLLDDQVSLAKYNQHIINKFENFLSKFAQGPADSVVDFGAGVGTLASLWFEKNGVKPVCIELDPKQRELLLLKGYATQPQIESLKEPVDIIYTSNVLEHIQDDLKALVEIRQQLVPRGLLLIYVPAFQFLFSELDTAVGHFRRYNRRSLSKVLDSAGFKVVHSEYADSLGVLATLVIKMIGFQKKHSVGNQKSIALYDKYIFPISRTLDSMLFRSFLGKNLFVVAVNEERMRGNENES